MSGFLEWYRQGGWVMHLILLVGLVGLAIFLERFYVIVVKSKINGRAFIERIIQLVRAGKVDDAIKLCAQSTATLPDMGLLILRSRSRDEADLQNVLQVIDRIKAKLEEVKGSLPPGVEIVTTYDRSALIERAIDNLSLKLMEEFIVVALVCAVFLWHLRSALVAIVTPSNSSAKRALGNTANHGLLEPLLILRRVVVPTARCFSSDSYAGSVTTMSTDSDGSVRKNATASCCDSSKLLGDDTDPYLSPRVSGFYGERAALRCMRTENVRLGPACGFEGARLASQ